MNLRLRVGLALFALVALVTAGAGALVQPIVVRPMAGDLLQGQIERTIAAADARVGGESLAELERRAGTRLRVDGGPADGAPLPMGPPPGGPWRPPPLPPGNHGWIRVERADHTVWVRPGPENEVAVRSGGEWLVSIEGTGLPMLARRLAAALAVGAVVVGVGVSWVAARALGPVEEAQRAMSKVASGDLAHRLDEAEGPPELRAVAAVFNRMATEVQRRVRAERELMAGLSHELRTPLTRIRLELELARRSGGDTGRIERLEADVAEIDGLVGELLELSRLEIGHVALRLEDVDLAALVADGGVPVEGEGRGRVDRRLVRRAVDNLVANSRRHAGGAAVRIRVGPSEIAVEDDGPGVREGELEALFEPFHRGVDAAGVGYGLGLAIVRQIARLHGGEARAESPGRGLRVVLTLGGREIG